MADSRKNHAGLFFADWRRRPGRVGGGGPIAPYGRIFAPPGAKAGDVVPEKEPRWFPPPAAVAVVVGERFVVRKFHRKYRG